MTALNKGKNRNRMVVFWLFPDEYATLKSACLAANGRDISDDMRVELRPLANSDYPRRDKRAGPGKTPVPVEDEEIEAIRAILRSGFTAQPWPFLRVGSKVYVEHGPLAGVEGIVTSTDKVYRLVVSVSLLQRSVAVEINREWARPIPDHMSPRTVTLSERTRSLARIS